ncbi:Hypothetical protein R9X50_00016300 [Acrodontium crateriforme]|uniref:SPT2 chromatin protein n=1 Tax=Acrodontium crateriforme TaxID=150365 RepID=A0AAQ3R4Q2_9PEZI|nr:Hypothetical protein R9X50_00016300 [Acrodontium crateriforme]
MTSFSNLLSSLGDKSQPLQTTASGQRPQQPTTKTARPLPVSARPQPNPSNAAAGMKRKSEEPVSQPIAKTVKTEGNGGLQKTPSAASGRYQLSATPKSASKAAPSTQRPTNSSNASSSLNRPLLKTSGRPAGTTPTTHPQAPPNGVIKPTARKVGFASILEKAKLAQEAQKQAAAVKKPAEKLTRKERERMKAEEEAARKAGRKTGMKSGNLGKNGTSVGAKAPVVQKKTPVPLGYQGTMKKVPTEPLYRGTMRAAGLGSAAPKAKQKGAAQDKYGGYASWSDLDDAEDDEDEGGYDSYDSDDMEGGFDDVEAEEQAALRLARREDKEAADEEERLRREKLQRKQKLVELSKTAAAKKRY